MLITLTIIYLQGVGPMDFDVAMQLIKRLEGGYVNDSKDKGGETKFGISKNAYPDLDIANLTYREAVAIYRRDYWDTIRGDDLPPAVALIVFDHAVNAGVSVAAKLLQDLVGVSQDGIVGPHTISFTEIWFYSKPFQTVRLLSEKRLRFYKRLRDYDIWGKAWDKRTLHVLTVATLWASADRLQRGLGIND
jgi:lysozyme family protein